MTTETDPSAVLLRIESLLRQHVAFTVFRNQEAFDRWRQHRDEPDAIPSTETTH